MDVCLILLQMVHLATQLLCLPVLILLQIPDNVLCARFLIILPTRVKSHFIMFEPYLNALVSRGHELVVISHFPQKEAVAHYTDIVLADSLMTPSSETGVSIEHVQSVKNPIVNVIRLAKYGVHTCETVLSHPSMKKLIMSDEEFDVVVNEVFRTDCFLPFAYKFKAISIGVSSSMLMPWANNWLGNPDNPSYIPNIFTSYSDHMNFIERIENGITSVLYKMIYHFFSDSPSQQLVHEYFGQDIPDLAELATNTSLLLVNSHFSLNAPRPLVPSVVETGGLHIPKPKPLPQVRKVFMFPMFSNISLHFLINRGTVNCRVHKLFKSIYTIRQQMPICVMFLSHFAHYQNISTAVAVIVSIIYKITMNHK